MNPKTEKSIQNLLLYAVSLALIVYVALRADLLSFTHDESLTYTILLGNPHWVHTTNNHLLNTFLMNLFYHLFGDGEFVLRLPNVLAFGFYLWGSISILKKLNNLWVSLLAMALLWFNPFVLDFFSLARGYGLSLGMLMMSLSFLLNISLAQPETKTFLRSFFFVFLFGGLAVTANLGVINYLLIIIAIYLVRGFLLLRSGKMASSKQKRGYFSILLFALAILFFCVRWIWLLRASHQFYFGAQSFNGTLFGLITGSYYFAQLPSWVYPSIKYLLLFFLFSGIFLIVARRAYLSRLSMIAVVNLLMILGLFLEHVLFHSNYPPGRTALYFVPLMGLFICCLFADLFVRFPSVKVIWIIFSLLMVLPLSWHLLDSLNLKYTRNWRYDAATKAAMMRVKKETRNDPNRATISNNWLFEPAINYYMHSRHIQIDSANRSGVHFDTRFIYKFNSDSCPQHYQVLEAYRDVNTVLLMESDTVSNSN
ncbi:MAG: hypothetical protein JXR71_10930 [Bacteroidales bacterium]|nr:hypothetical protein [Bacteroidales bacterium]